MKNTNNYIGRFILSPHYYALSKKYGGQTLRAVHGSLNIEDRITAIIRKEKILQYPEGILYAGKYILSICPVYACFKYCRCSM